jgi:hypothetical protein
MTAGSAALAAIPVCDASGFMRFRQPSTEFSISPLLTIFKEGAEDVFLRLADTRHIYQTRCSLHDEVLYVKCADGK